MKNRKQMKIEFNGVAWNIMIRQNEADTWELHTGFIRRECNGVDGFVFEGILENINRCLDLGYEMVR